MIALAELRPDGFAAPAKARPPTRCFEGLATSVAAWSGRAPRARPVAAPISLRLRNAEILAATALRQARRVEGARCI